MKTLRAVPPDAVGILENDAAFLRDNGRSAEAAALEARGQPIRRGAR